MGQPDELTLLRRLERDASRRRVADVEMQRLAYVHQASQGAGPPPLACFSERSFSQNGEDGILTEVFSRLGRTVTSFVEIGAGDGTENNTIRWLLDGATGAWFEAGRDNVKSIRAHHGDAIAQNRLAVFDGFVNAENVGDLLREAGTPLDLDILSIDIDGNDFWVWNAIEDVRPRVVVCEYNARFGSSLSWTMSYDPHHVWPGRSCHFGASLKALERLGNRKGYRLIGADFMGANAFFLRDDLLDTRAFTGPYTAEAVFQPFRRGFGELPSGKAAAFGSYVNI